MISIRGSAADDLEVSQFLNALHQNNLFERVQLLFTDQHVRKDRTMRSFAIRLRTQPVAGRLNHRPEIGTEFNVTSRWQRNCTT